MATACEACGRLPRTQGSRHQQCWRHAAERGKVESGRLLAQRRRNRSRHGGVRRIVMNRLFTLALLPAIAAITALSLGSLTAAPVKYKLPEETVALKPGPNLEVVKNNCTASIRWITSAPSRAGRNSKRISGRPK